MLFALKKVMAAFILPPGLFIICLAIMGCWAVHRKLRPLGQLSLLVGGLMWLLSIGPTASFMMGTLETGYRPMGALDTDVILMLGGDLYDGAADLSGTGAPGPGTMERLVTAARLYRRYQVPIVVSGGKVIRSRTQSIASVSKRFLVDLGIPAEAIITEEDSRDTYENAVHCKRLCDARGFTKPVLVTSGYHLRRAVWSFNDIGLAVAPYPCALTTWPGKSHHFFHFLPSAGALAGTSRALHEWVGLAVYRMVH